MSVSAASKETPKEALRAKLRDAVIEALQGWVGKVHNEGYVDTMQDIIKQLRNGASGTEIHDALLLVDEAMVGIHTAQWREIDAAVEALTAHDDRSDDELKAEPFNGN